jgi:hypothetical protein
MSGGCLQGYVTLSYKELRKIFGAPLHGDEYKVSTEWGVEDTLTGRIFTVYDWKATKFYDECYPSVRKFRQLPEYEWHIGGNNFKQADLDALSRFLSEQCGRHITVTRSSSQPQPW